ncbi:unnamed protein product [Parnassius mnemosyne]|uniref:Uncharacterized protein n=1 Tax=Parnassius mnemosyne TaxID=213953 RepID=A0AAV1KIS8_9NEOP
MILKYVLFISIFIYKVICRDYYAGMFKKNDILVAQDRVFKGRVPWEHTYAKYGRIFKCPITYIRVANRLGTGGSSTAQIIRGGILYKYVVILLTSPYDLPISVNIYIGCENKMTTTKRTKRTTTTTTTTKTTRATVKSSSGNQIKTIASTRADLNESTTVINNKGTGSTISPTTLTTVKI